MKKASWRDLWSIQNEAISLVAIRGKESWLVEKNRATVKPGRLYVGLFPPWSNLTRASLLVEWKLTAKADIELRNLQILKKMLEKSSQFLPSEQPCEPKAWTLPWKLQELKKYPRKTCGYGQPRSHLIRGLKKRSVNEGGDFCLLWLVILKSAWFSVGDTF